jgi:hypothetical protein
VLKYFQNIIIIIIIVGCAVYTVQWTNNIFSTSIDRHQTINSIVELVNKKFIYFECSIGKGGKVVMVLLIDFTMMNR